MNEAMKSMMNKTKETLMEISQSILDKVDQTLNTETMTLSQLVFFIQNHERAKHQTKTLLGTTYRFYELKIGQSLFILETKNKDYLLKLHIYRMGIPLFQYHSFEKKQEQTEAITIPTIAFRK